MEPQKILIQITQPIQRKGRVFWFRKIKWARKKVEEKQWSFQQQVIQWQNEKGRRFLKKQK